MKFWLEKWSYVCVDLPLDLLSTWKVTLSSKNVTSRFVKASGKENQALKYTFLLLSLQVDSKRRFIMNIIFYFSL